MSRPQFVPPMLAKLVTTPPSGEGWVYERKLDGLRCIAVRDGNRVELWSRSRLSFTARFGGIVDAVRQLPADAVVFDGEIVAMDGDRTSFSLLQRPGSTATPILSVFDVLHLGGEDLTARPLLERKKVLEELVGERGTLRLVRHVEGDPEQLLQQACVDGWEGLIAKRADGPYRSGRSSDWLKLKCSASQELVIGGWTEPKGSRTGFGALLVGYHDDTGLRYAGKVGTGFDTATLTDLHRRMTARSRDTSPFVDRVRQKDAHWTEPDLVANIAFTEWTEDGKLRHPRYEGLRPDKDPRTVVRERPPGP
ncbi:MAG TPA: non-homologous end-joining DNA ligase [Acidimicrobiia bacterium]|nr:non-homologous end-joining DNA ligase [Acidimicrobiia bacterium]